MARHVEEAIRIAQDAVRADEACDFEEAVALYTRSVESIKRGLQVQREDEAVDNTVLHRYLKLYSERIAVLGEHRKHRASIVASSGPLKISRNVFSSEVGCAGSRRARLRSRAFIL